MAEETNWLLTDEFMVFSDQIKQIHESKKQKELRKQEIKELYKKTEAEIKELELQAKKLQDDFHAMMQQLEENNKKEKA